jgi:hypothetical protein
MTQEQAKKQARKQRAAQKATLASRRAAEKLGRRRDFASMPPPRYYRRSCNG